MRYQGPELDWYEVPCVEIQEEIDPDLMLDKMQDMHDHEEELYNMMMG